MPIAQKNGPSPERLPPEKKSWTPNGQCSGKGLHLRVCCHPRQPAHQPLKLISSLDAAPNLDGPVQTSGMHCHFVNLIDNAASMINK